MIKPRTGSKDKDLMSRMRLIDYKGELEIDQVVQDNPINQNAVYLCVFCFYSTRSLTVHVMGKTKTVRIPNHK